MELGGRWGRGVYDTKTVIKKASLLVAEGEGRGGTFRNQLLAPELLLPVAVLALVPARISQCCYQFVSLAIKFYLVRHFGSCLRALVLNVGRGFLNTAPPQHLALSGNIFDCHS